MNLSKIKFVYFVSSREIFKVKDGELIYVAKVNDVNDHFAITEYFPATYDIDFPDNDGSLVAGLKSHIITSDPFGIVYKHGV